MHIEVSAGCMYHTCCYACRQSGLQAALSKLAWPYNMAIHDLGNIPMPYQEALLHPNTQRLQIGTDLNIEEVTQRLLFNDLLDGGVPFEGDWGWHNLCDEVRFVAGGLQHLPCLFCVHGLHCNTPCIISCR